MAGAGQGESAVLGLDLSATEGHGRARQPVHAEVLECGTDADDVSDRVHGPHLVKVDLVRRDPVDLGLRFREPAEDP